YDMHGNMNEWCADWYDKRYYAESARINPIGPTSGGERVVRGGAWGNKPPYCRSANRGDATPSSRGPYLGFRVASAAGETNASGKSREEERPEELAPEEPEPEPPATTVRTRNPRNSDSSKVPSVAKTMWAGTDSDGDYYEYHFKKGGALHYKSPSGFHDNGTWKQDGISIYCEMNNKYSERRGSIRGERIEGDAWNVKGKRWTWSVEKQ
ncbi:MAG: SUMF1/EgtB/PvdO family nonheme iron enzyme, partial [Planctomycetes bacterium]|nr:SUMF1/EgtB/PvdO family nonheme iron enzyme [Planctomycetota bacterium]